MLPGAGKTEFSKELTLGLGDGGKSRVARIDADEIRDKLPHYAGDNAYLFQGAVSVAVEKIHDSVLANKQNFILDGTLSNLKKAENNINRSLNKNRAVFIFYIYQDPVVAWNFTERREEKEGRRILKETFIKQFIAAKNTVDKLKEHFGKKIVVYLVEKDFKQQIIQFKANINRMQKMRHIGNTPDLADIFLLDEPTNNLDLRGLILLEKFILADRRSFFVVSHDRKFLDRLTVGVIEINDKTYSVNTCRNATYTSYIKKRELQEKQEIEDYEDFQKEKKRLEESAYKKKEKALKMAHGPKKRRDSDKHIVGFKKDRAKGVASAASAIQKTVERLAEVKKPKFHLPLNLRFQFSERSGDVVSRLSEAEARQDNFHLGPIDLEINFGDRVVFLGPNGEGKSTLLKFLLGEFTPVGGVSKIGSRVKIGYLSQETTARGEENALEFFLKAVELDQSNSRKILKRFGFSADDLTGSCQDLSPGERARLALATLMAKDINCLVLDEPSNHLDPEALDRVEEALKDFPGTIVIVSHDRYLIDQIGVTKTYLMENGKISVLRDYHEYEERVFSGD